MTELKYVKVRKLIAKKSFYQTTIEFFKEYLVSYFSLSAFALLTLH